MEKTSFIIKLARKINTDFQGDFQGVVIVLPNKRAKVFLEDALKKEIQQTSFSPKIISIEEFLYEITRIKSIDSIELLFEFYEVYLSMTPKDAVQSFDVFSSWATILLQDFNEIDRYLLDPVHVLSYLKDINDINHWSLDIEKRTHLIENYLDFYSRLHIYYTALYKKLLHTKKGYQGLIYREAIRSFEELSFSESKHFVFAGFNALNAAEEKIFQFFLINNKGSVFWDVDKTFLNDSFHESGLFARKYISQWKQYQTHDFNWIVDEFSKTKNISIIGTSKSIGQTKIAGIILEQIPSDKLSHTAVVLGDENLLLPILNALPNSVDRLNITMGMPAKNNPVQVFFNKLFRLHINAINRGGTYVFYYKELLDVLSHPLMNSFMADEKLYELIKVRNITFITYNRLIEEVKDSPNIDLYNLLLSPWDGSNSLVIIDVVFKLIQKIRISIDQMVQTDPLTKVFLHAIHTVFVRLKNYFTRYTDVQTAEMLFALYKQVVQLAEVSFEGEPLGGLQLMGLLESRTLDFENVIITSLNEGSLPAGKSTQSFIPYDVKIELGLPTYKEKDAIYAYHFYHLLMRSENIYLLYNTESEGLDAGEKSRFITQLEIEKQPNHTITHQIHTPYLPSKPYQAICIPKSTRVQERLREISEKGFSPSSLTNYLRDPVQFYYQRILRIREVEEVEESIALNTLGTIIHETLYELYQPFIAIVLEKKHIANMEQLLEKVLTKQFELIYADGDVKNGKNLLAFEVAKRNISNLLKIEFNRIEAGDQIKIIALEQKCSRVIQHERLPHDVVIAGSVDRIEECNGIIRVIDYKTGKVMPSSLVLKDWNLILDTKYDKIIQILTYSFMYEPFLEGKSLEAGIISFKNLALGFMPFVFKDEKDKISDITSDTLLFFQEKIVDLLLEILDVSIPFSEKK